MTHCDSNLRWDPTGTPPACKSLLIKCWHRVFASRCLPHRRQGAWCAPRLSYAPRCHTLRSPLCPALASTPLLVSHHNYSALTFPLEKTLNSERAYLSVPTAGLQRPVGSVGWARCLTNQPWHQLLQYLCVLLHCAFPAPPGGHAPASPRVRVGASAFATCVARRRPRPWPSTSTKGRRRRDAGSCAVSPSHSHSLTLGSGDVWEWEIGSKIGRDSGSIMIPAEARRSLGSA